MPRTAKFRNRHGIRAMPSIKLRLVVIFAAVFSVALAALGLSMYVKLKDIAVGSIDSHLHSEVQLIAGLITSEHENLEVELHKMETGDYAVALSGHYFQVVLESGELIARSPSLSLANVTLPPRGTEESFEPVLKNITGPEYHPHPLFEKYFSRIPCYLRFFPRRGSRSYVLFAAKLRCVREATRSYNGEKPEREG